MTYKRLLFLAVMLTLFPSTARGQDTREDRLGDGASFQLSDTQAVSAHIRRDERYRTPAMIGDFFGGAALGFRGDQTLGSTMVWASDLDAPLILPGPASLLSISELGPVGIYQSSIASIQQIQALLQASQPLPSAAVVGAIADNATLTTALTVSDLQAALAGAALPYEIIALQAPPGSYQVAVAANFAALHGPGGTTVYDPAGSGALIQGGANALNGGEDLDAFYFYNYAIRFDTAIADASSGGVGRLKIAEGGTVLPQNRIFMRYNYFDSVKYAGTGVALNRFTPGFEREFLDGLFSVELRAPFATDTQVENVLNGGTIGSGSSAQFGNLTTYLKALLVSRSNLAVSGGLGISLPTASDIRVDYADGTSLLNIRNEAVHLQPFLGFLYTPTVDWFAHGFMQYDVAASGNTVELRSAGGHLSPAGRLTDPNHIFLDLGVGFWAYRSNASRGLTGVIPTLELHQASSLQGGDSVSSGAFQVGNFGGSTSITSVVAGSTLEFGQRSQLIVGYATPLSGGADRQYDGALSVTLNRVLGN